MQQVERFLQDLLGISIWSVMKVLVLFGLLLYLVFAMVVIRQVKLMSGTLNGTLNIPLRLIATVHMIFAVCVFLFALVVL